MNNRELARTICFDNMSAFGKEVAKQQSGVLRDALVNNLFKGNATIIGEWATASHVERQGTRKAKPAAGGGTAPAPKP